ncbi:hypothetical protein SAMN05444064_101329 [Pseudomonas syringae]|nr:hypothetical protein SAMN05444514_101331 [Pseudomonas syringae]SFL40632.1 hypothetical protein SAMN05444064_101329 [Pseudomonas syringae]
MKKDLDFQGLFFRLVESWRDGFASLTRRARMCFALGLKPFHCIPSQWRKRPGYLRVKWSRFLIFCPENDNPWLSRDILKKG